MKSFFRNGLLFIIFFLVFAEVFSRIFQISTDAPKTFKNKRGNIKFYPDQEGYWDGGSHKWYINSLGFLGKNLPNSFDNLVKIIGDSYIENFMNPDSCRQKKFLSKLKPEFNFMEVAMSGYNLLGYFEAAYEVDSLPSKYTLMYVNTKDFLQSIQEISKNNSNQLSIETGITTYPKYRGSKLKDLLYNFKFPYYLYRKNLHLFQDKNKKTKIDILKQVELSKENLILISKLLAFIKNSYKTNNVVFVLHPNVEDEIYEVSLESGIKTFRLEVPVNKDYKTKNHGHWNCYGHKEIARQVSSFLDSLSNN